MLKKCKCDDNLKNCLCIDPTKFGKGKNKEFNSGVIYPLIAGTCNGVDLGEGDMMDVANETDIYSDLSDWCESSSDCCCDCGCDCDCCCGSSSDDCDCCCTTNPCSTSASYVIPVTQAPAVQAFNVPVVA